MITRNIRWQGENAVEHNCGGLCVVMVPARGGKIVSIRDADGMEWLAQPRLPLPPPARCGADFIAAEMCGWDECAPSIVACTLSDGTIVADHGELWTQPWQMDGNVASVHGESFGYDFSRRIDVRDERSIRLHYEVHAGVKPVPFLWGAHPQFLAPPGTRVAFSSSVDEVVDVLNEKPVIVPWEPRLAEIDSVGAGQARKFYLQPDTSVDRVSLVRTDRKRLTISWDPALVPYLGVWFDAVKYSREPVIALEPSTGWYDAVDAALGHNKVLRVAAHETFSWTLNLNIE